MSPWGDVDSLKNIFSTMNSCKLLRQGVKTFWLWHTSQMFFMKWKFQTLLPRWLANQHSTMTKRFKFSLTVCIYLFIWLVFFGHTEKYFSSTTVARNGGRKPGNAQGKPRTIQPVTRRPSHVWPEGKPNRLYVERPASNLQMVVCFHQVQSVYPPP